MRRKLYTNGYMIYGCDSCGKGFKMYLEETLGKNKPVPFTIQCPFCKKIDCRDVSFGCIHIPRQRITKHMPAFINRENMDCGDTWNMHEAVSEFFKKDNGNENEVVDKAMSSDKKLDTEQPDH